MLNKIINNSTQFFSICRTHNIQYLYAFGSVTNDTFNTDSDIDLLVELYETDPIKKGELLISLWDTFENYFKRKVDLLTPSSLKNPYLIKQIENTKILVYHGEESEIIN